ncbi:MAG TPA: pyridoxamine 5'-phosphate oxidase family protein [Acidimicrobiales bacterium]
MPLVEGRTGLEVILAPRCWELLASGRVGRLGYIHDGGPEIVPVNYQVDDETIVFRTDPGTKLVAVRRNTAVAFEIDHTEPADETGWSVLVKGVAERVTDAREVSRLDGLGLRPWVTGDKETWIRIRPDSVSGRAVYHFGEAQEDARSETD